jgi:ferredoxin-NADP reductase
VRSLTQIDKINMAKPFVQMPVESVTPEIPDTRTLSLRWPEGYAVEVRTGQFITLFWPDTPQYKRAYSLSSCGLDRGFYQVTVKREGKMGTRMVDWADVGDILGVLPPVGRFLPVFEPEKHLICMAGGSGVTPFRGFVREAIRRQLTTRITLLYSVRTPDEIIYRNQLPELARENPYFHYEITCTRLPENDPWQGRRGRLDLTWLKQHIRDLPNTIFYACGPNGLVEAAEQIVLQELGVPKEQLKTEKWG